MYRKDFIYSLKSKRGQATVEYVLILVIAVGIIIGGVLKFNKNFDAYARYIYGEYMTCLLETGELPSLGAGESDECPLPKLGAVPGLGGNGLGNSGGSSSSKGDADKEGANK